MSQIFRGILGGLAIALSFGAVQFALGRDLVGSQDAAGTPPTAINRAAKTDRAATAPGSAAPTRTILLRFDGLSDTSVLLRVPVADASRNHSSARSLMKPGDAKATVACEPMVSVLTEVARLLQPGRCVT